MAQARESREQLEQAAESKEPAAADQPEPGPEPAPLQQAVQVELPTLSARKCEPQPGRSCVIGRQRLRFHAAHQSDREVVETKVSSLPSEVDLREPFERIREALEETIRSGSTR
jgi:hypothetical protein